MAENDEIRYKITVDSETGTASVRNLKGQIVATQVPIQKLRAEFGNFAKTVNATNFNKFNSGLKETGDAVSQMRTASGGATSSVLELGRVIQDAPYGLRGMANNITQLASQMAFATKSAGGFGKALKEMGRAMAGPLGVVFLISLVVSAMEMLQGSISKTEKDLDKLTDASITNAVSELTTLKNIIEDTSISLERKQEAIRLANEEYSELNISIDGTADSAIQALTALDLLIDKFSDVAYANAITELQVEAMKELANANRDTEGSFSDLFSSFQAFSSGMLSLTTGGNAFDMAKAVNIAGIEEDLKDIENLFKQPTKADPNLTYADLIFGKKDTKGRGGRSIANRPFKEQMLDLEKFILSKGRDLALAVENNEFEQLKIRQEFAKDDLKLTKDTFITKQKLRFKQFVEAQAKRLDMSVEEYKAEEKYAEEKAKLDKSISDAELSYTRAADSLQLLQTEETANKKLEIELKYAELISKARVGRARSEWDSMKATTGGTKAGSLGSPMSSVGAEGIESQIASQRALNEAELAEFNRAEEARRTELENSLLSTMEIEGILFEERMVFQNTMAVREIELERQKIDAKMSINQEYISWLGGLGSVLKDIAGQNEALATAALVLEKGSAIADIIVKTQAANAAVTVNSSKAASGYQAAAATQASFGNLAGAAVFQGLATKATVTGKTRILKNNIGAGISIAKIAATTLQSRSAGGGGSGGGGGESGGRTFDFNLVGSTGENQLAQGIAGQVSTPVQAFVVSSQMTSQQQLDNAIQTSATLGD